VPNLETGLSKRRYDDVTSRANDLDAIAISVKSHKLLKQLLGENPELEEIMRNSENEVEALLGVKNWITSFLQDSPEVASFLENGKGKAFESLKWRDYAIVRLLDYVDSAGREVEDLNLRGELAISNPIKMVWLAVKKGTGGAKPYFFEDMLHLFRQLSGKEERKLPTK
jgi:lysine 2,3-aminomutase